MNLTSPLREDQYQSHCFMTIFSNFINQGITSHSKMKRLRYFRLRHKQETQHTTAKKIDKQGLRITLRVLKEVKDRFLETKEFIDDRLEQKCLKENIPVDGVIFLCTSLQAYS